MNRLVLIGRSTRDMELRTTNSGTSMVRFSLAVDRKNREQGADFINCVAFGKCAELVAQYVKKGHKIAVSGHLQTGSYEKDGKKNYTMDVVADSVEFLEKKEQRDTRREEEEEFVPVVDADEELPF